MNQYIITEEQVEEFGDYVEDDDNHTEEKYKNARGLVGKIRSNPYNPQAEREKVLAKVIADINRVSLTGFTKYTYRRWILEELRQEGKQEQK